MHPSRRRFLKVLGGAGLGAAVSAPFMRAFADNPATSDEFFVFLLATGGWDVTLWSDPRNTTQGLVNPASDKNTNITVIPDPDLWKPVPLDGGDNSFELLTPAGKSPLVFGPGIGRLIDHYDRLCLVNGLAMNTVSHPDGKAFSATGRHLAGGHPAASSIDTMVANELGLLQLLPNVSIVFPSSFIGTNLDARAAPLIVDSVGTIGKSLSRSSLYDTSADRDAVTAVLTEEALDLAKLSDDPDPMNGMALQFGSLKKMLSPTVQPTFSASALTMAQPDFFDNGAYKPKFQTDSATNAAFAVEAMRLNLVRCVSFAFNAFDTHNTNYQFHLQTQQEAFNVLATLLAVLDKTPHPTLTGKMLSDHTHILVVSDFCRTPQINLAGGRDHYPNNSALVISPKFKQNYLYSGTDEEQVLPKDVMGFSDGPRPIGPPDLLTTFVSAFGIDPRKYLRDGEVVKDLLV